MLFSYFLIDLLRMFGAQADNLRGRFLLEYMSSACSIHACMLHANARLTVVGFFSIHRSDKDGLRTHDLVGTKQLESSPSVTSLKVCESSTDNCSCIPLP